MAKKHDELLAAAKDAIEKVFADTSVPAHVTRRSLKDIASEVQIRLDTLRLDLRQARKDG